MQNTKVLSTGCPKCGGEVCGQDSQWKCANCSFWLSALDATGQRLSLAEVENKLRQAGGKRHQQPSPDPTPSCDLDEVLADVQRGHQQPATKLAPNPPPKSAPKHPNLIEGDGTREFPFVIHTSNTIRSAQIQREIIDGIYGEGTKASASRIYYESPRGLPGNGDLCEHRFLLNGKETSVWFDLYLVTRLVNDPELNRVKSAMMAELSQKPEFQQLQNEIRKKLGLPTQRQPKGCAGVAAVLAGIVALLWLFCTII